MDSKDLIAVIDRRIELLKTRGANEPEETKRVNAPLYAFAIQELELLRRLLDN